MRQDVMEFGDFHARVLTQQELNISERVAPYNSGYIDKVADIDENEEEQRKRKAYYRSIRKNRAGLSKESYYRVIIIFEAYLVLVHIQ